VPSRSRPGCGQQGGEISRELETAERARTDLLPNGGKQTKAKALADAGISTSTANRFEELAAGWPVR
jgi:hypothetical protein